MTDLPVTEARDHLAAIINRVASSGEAITLTRRGHRLAAIVPIEVLDAFEAIKDRIDIEAAKESYAETGEDITLNQLREDLHLPRTATSNSLEVHALLATNTADEDFAADLTALDAVALENPARPAD